MKKRLLALMLVFATIFSLAACGSGKSDAVTLSVMGKKSDLEKSYMTAIFERYEESSGNKLKIIAYEDAEFEEEAAKAFKEGDAPDVLLHFHNADLNRFDVADNFLYLNDEKWISDLTDSAKAYCLDSEGNLLGLPFWESSVSGCYYNKTILRDLGLKPAATQEEFDALCQVLADSGYAPICWPGDGCSWMPQFGLDPIFADDPQMLEKINENGISYADIPQVLDMVKWLAKAQQKGWFNDDFLKTGWDDVSEDMSSGKAVMTFIWDTWFYTDFAEDGKYTVDDFALMPVFMNTAEHGTYEGGNLNMMMVNKNGKNVDTALDFLDFCATAENYNAAFDGISTVNCFNGQTTNIQSAMVTEAAASIAANERVSTASSRVVGYSGDDVVAALNMMFTGKVDADGCVRLMDEYRIKEAEKQGIAGF